MRLAPILHLVSAGLALASGGLVLAFGKGTRRHRFLGRIYVGSMLALDLTALSIFRLFDGFGPFHVAALISLATVLPGYLAARSKPPGWLVRHYFWMTFSYVGLLAAAAAEVLTRLPAAPFWPAVVVASAGVLGVGAWVVFTRARGVLAPFATSSAATASKPAGCDFGSRR